MASFRGHLTTSTVLGVMYGFAGFWSLGVRWWMGMLGSGMTALAGLLPDLDSDSSVPNRTLFRIAGPCLALLSFQHALTAGLPLERAFLRMLVIFVIVRYGLCYLMRKVTVHRGMFHSIPAMLIAGLAIFVIYLHMDRRLRLFLAGAVIAGYLSHLVLDEICAVDFQGGRIKKPFGTALKLFSQNWLATTVCYGVLFLLALLALMED